MEDVGKELIESSKENPLVVADVQGKLTSVRAQIDNFDARIEERRQNLQNILLQIQNFEVLCDEFMVKLAELEMDVANVLPISAIHDTAEEQRDEIQAYTVDNIARKEPVYEKILQDGRTMLNEVEPGDEKDELNYRLDEMTRRWEAMKENTADLMRNTSTIVEAAKKYVDSVQPFKDWLDETEKKLNKIRPETSDPEKIDEILQELREIKKDVTEHEKPLDIVSDSAKALVDCAQADQSVITADFAEVKRRYEELEASLLNKKNKAEKIKETMGKYKSALQPIQEAFTQAEYVLAIHEPAGTNADKIREELELVKALVSTLEERKPDLKEVNLSGQELLQSAGEQAPTVAVIKEELLDTNKKSREVPEQLLERQKDLEKALEDATDFNAAFEELEEWIPTATENVDNLEPVGSVPEKIKAQLKETEALEEELQRYLVTLRTLEETGQRMIEDSMQDPEVVADIRNKINKVRNPIDKLSAKLEQRIARLQSAALQSQEFQDSYSDVIARLMKIEEGLVSKAHISPEYQTTKKQKEELESVQDMIDQQEPVVEKLVEAGEKLLESTEPGEEKEVIKQQLAEIKKRWDGVKDKAAERKNKLESVLPEAKDYHYMHQEFEPWLSDTESKLNGIKLDDPNPHHICKQQQVLQDLKDELEKHKPDFETLNKNAEFLTDNCKENSAIIEAQIKDVNKRWNTLNKALEDKEMDLECAKNTVGKYFDAVAGVEEVLSKANVVLDSQEPPGLDAVTAKDDLEKVTEVLEQLQENEPRKKDAKEAGEKLLDQMDEDSPSASILKQQLDSLGERYADTLDKAKDRKSELEKVVVLIIQFVEQYEVIEIWIEQVTIVVQTFQVISPHPKVAKTQLEEVETIQEEVVQHRWVLERDDHNNNGNNDSDSDNNYNNMSIIIRTKMALTAIRRRRIVVTMDCYLFLKSQKIP